MNKRQMTKWVKALRSGKYKQGTARLRINDYYCCLGVLEEINGGRCKGGGLSVAIKKKTGMNSEYGSRDDGGRVLGHISLATANDFGVSFRRIATWIEKHYKKL